LHTVLFVTYSMLHQQCCFLTSFILTMIWSHVSYGLRLQVATYTSRQETTRDFASIFAPFLLSLFQRICGQCYSLSRM
jgi:hypothetical protein